MKTYTYPDSGIVLREDLSEWLDQYVKQTPEKMNSVVKKSAFVIQADSAADAPVDTGNLKNSLSAEEEKLLIWSVTDGTDYGIFPELGTSKIPAQHFLGGAAEREAEPFFDNVLEALKP